MNISKFFIQRPIFAAVLSIVIFVGGLIAIPLLPISEYPDVVPPTVLVRATYPGANPKVLSETVAAPLEQTITGVEHMMYMKSVASSDGTMLIIAGTLCGARLCRQSATMSFLIVCTCVRSALSVNTTSATTMAPVIGLLRERTRDIRTP